MARDLRSLMFPPLGQGGERSYVEPARRGLVCALHRYNEPFGNGPVTATQLLQCDILRCSSSLDERPDERSRAKPRAMLPAYRLDRVLAGR